VHNISKIFSPEIYDVIKNLIQDHHRCLIGKNNDFRSLFGIISQFILLFRETTIKYQKMAVHWNHIYRIVLPGLGGCVVPLQVSEKESNYNRSNDYSS
jgi:hypothetical protein